MTARDPPPVLVVCCGQLRQIAVDGMTECPECGALHRVRHRERPGRDVVTDGGTDEIPVCPECDSHRIRPRNGRNANRSIKRWRCECGAEFDEPTYRLPKNGITSAKQYRPNISAAGRAALEWARRQEEAEPEVRTDGGVAPRCPNCHTAVHALATVGPGDHRLEPCGHRAPAWIRRQFTEPTIPDGGTMQRVTLRVPKQQLDEIEELVERGVFPNRSEAIRQGIREMLSPRQQPVRVGTGRSR